MIKTPKKRTFVRFNKLEFERSISGWAFVEVNLKGTWEYVYDIVVPGVTGYAIRIYSSIDKITSFSRDMGTDAIRLMIIKSNDYTHFGDQQKILRTTGWQKRVSSRILSLIEHVQSTFCAKCNSVMLIRSGVHGKFMGCSRYPTCTYTTSLK